MKRTPQDVLDHVVNNLGLKFPNSTFSFDKTIDMFSCDPRYNLKIDGSREYGITLTYYLMADMVYSDELLLEYTIGIMNEVALRECSGLSKDMPNNTRNVYGSAPLHEVRPELAPSPAAQKRAAEKAKADAEKPVQVVNSEGEVKATEELSTLDTTVEPQSIKVNIGDANALQARILFNAALDGLNKEITPDDLKDVLISVLAE